MWQEARKHERKLRGMMVDYKRRGERRREYYEKIVRLSCFMSTLLHEGESLTCHFIWQSFMKEENA